jgi:hypothetical protein
MRRARSSFYHRKLEYDFYYARHFTFLIGRHHRAEKRFTS